ncbi:hypothetical protein HELRODRAFT_180974 [Helobdella robusta]|uniref:Uncharacterized protein n=1 Tax=Helobdella robusta TaxID=6412 RepID=T1FGH1_HELRO|nr:hypothetical protein HELRODRAFT_180974 [Helobdella robusta]ESN93435.1 hypothetical protein HELRODRAFT_180974 [Helobdella robusta]
MLWMFADVTKLIFILLWPSSETNLEKDKRPSQNNDEQCRFSIPDSTGTKINETNFEKLHWHRVGNKTSREVTYVFSAFLDIRNENPSIRILGITEASNYDAQVKYCRVWDENSNVQIAVLSVGSVTNETLVRSKYYEMLYTCTIALHHKFMKPAYVTLINAECDEPNFYLLVYHSDLYQHRLDYFKTNSLHHHYPKHNQEHQKSMFEQHLSKRNLTFKGKHREETDDLFISSTKHVPQNSTVDFTICSPTRVVSEIPFQFFIEWIELNRHLGVQRFFIFKLRTQDENKRSKKFKDNSNNKLKLNYLFKYYQHLGLLTIIEWSFPVKYDQNRDSLIMENSYIIGIDIALTYCLYLNMYKTKYIMNLALDEYVTSARYYNLSTFFEKFEHDALHNNERNNISSTNDDKNNSHILNSMEKDQVALFYFPTVFYSIFGDLNMEMKKTHEHMFKTSILLRRFSKIFKFKSKYVVRATAAQWLTLFDAHLLQTFVHHNFSESAALMRSFLLLRLMRANDEFPLDDKVVNPPDDVSFESHVTFVYNILPTFFDVGSFMTTRDVDENDVNNSDTNSTATETLFDDINVNGRDDSEVNREEENFKKWIEQNTEIDLYMEAYEMTLWKRFLFVLNLSNITDLLFEEEYAQYGDDGSRPERKKDGDIDDGDSDGNVSFVSENDAGAALYVDNED